jgi:hypothetical protein
MTFKFASPRRVAATIGVLVAGVALFLPLPMSASSESACEANARWAAEYERTTPAPTLDDFARFDRPQRVALFNAVSPDVRASLFQEQLRRFSERPDLTSDQRALIAEGASLLTADLYRKDPVATQSFRTFWSRADASFTSPDQRRAWFDIGGLNAARAQVVLVDSVGALKANVGCDCSFSFQDCGTWGCYEGSCTQSTGCGPGGGSRCDGICAPVRLGPSLTGTK